MQQSTSQLRGVGYRRVFPKTTHKYHFEGVETGAMYDSSKVPNASLRPAPYLPVIEYIQKDINPMIPVVMKAGTLVSVDENNYLVPCNGGVESVVGVYSQLDVEHLVLKQGTDNDAIQTSDIGVNVVIPPNKPFGVLFHDAYQDTSGAYINFDPQGEGIAVATLGWAHFPFIPAINDGGSDAAYLIHMGLQRNEIIWGSGQMFNTGGSWTAPHNEDLAFAGVLHNVILQDTVYEVKVLVMDGGAGPAPANATNFVEFTDFVINPNAGTDGADQIQFTADIGATKDVWVYYIVRGSSYVRSDVATSDQIPVSDVSPFKNSGSLIVPGGSAFNYTAIDRQQKLISAATAQSFGAYTRISIVTPGFSRPDTRLSEGDYVMSDRFGNPVKFTPKYDDPDQIIGRVYTVEQAGDWKNPQYPWSRHAGNMVQTAPGLGLVGSGTNGLPPHIWDSGQIDPEQARGMWINLQCR